MQGVSAFDSITGMTAIGGVAPFLALPWCAYTDDFADFADDLYRLRFSASVNENPPPPPPTAPTPPIPMQLCHLPYAHMQTSHNPLLKHLSIPLSLQMTTDIDFTMLQLPLRHAAFRTNTTHPQIAQPQYSATLRHRFCLVKPPCL